MLSYHNDPELKQLIVDEMHYHKERDQIIKGTYGKDDGGFKGCAVGCAIHSFNTKLGKSYSTNDHKSFEEAIGVPEWMAYLQDRLFEMLPEDESAQFAVDFLDAIPVGVNLEPIKWKFCAFLMKENIKIVSKLPHISDELRTQVLNAIQQVLNLHEDAINTGVWNIKAAEDAEGAANGALGGVVYASYAAWAVARSAARAAAVWGAANGTWAAAVWGAANGAAATESAAESAAENVRIAKRDVNTRKIALAAGRAESAAESAAESVTANAANAAESAAESAGNSARSAAYKKYAKELLRLLKESGT